MIISLDINDKNASSFLNFIKELDFVRINRTELDEKQEEQFISERLIQLEQTKNQSEKLENVLREVALKHGF